MLKIDLVSQIVNDEESKDDNFEDILLEINSLLET